MRRYVLIGAGVLILIVFAAMIASRRTEERPKATLPDSMAVIGDSISQAVAVNTSSLGGAAEHSWATGTDETDDVLSHYERLIAAHPAIAGNAYNNSVPGARMSDAGAQASITVSQHPDYVLFLMGGNDVCAPAAASMTSATDFESSFRSALDSLTTGLPEASIYVVSIPNLYRLWEVGHDDLVASTVWANAGVCQSMLSDNESDREQARERNAQYNEILEEVCDEYSNCLYDGGAVYDYEFSADEVGPIDHFHPSEEGQAALAEISWDNGYWPDL